MLVHLVRSNLFRAVLVSPPWLSIAASRWSSLSDLVLKGPSRASGTVGKLRYIFPRPLSKILLSHPLKGTSSQPTRKDLTCQVIPNARNTLITWLMCDIKQYLAIVVMRQQFPLTAYRERSHPSQPFATYHIR